MKKLTLFLVYLGILIVSTFYLYRSGTLFLKGIQNFQEKQNIAAGLSFAELLTQYTYSPFVGVAKVYMVYRDPTKLLMLDMYYQTQQKKDVFSVIVGVTPAYYDPYFFASVVFFLLMSMLGVAQRYWAGSLGLSFKGLTGRDTFAFLLCVLYFFWVRGAYTPDTVVYRLAGSVNSWFNSGVGAAAVTAGFSALMTVVNLIVVCITLFTFLGSPSRKKKEATETDPV